MADNRIPLDEDELAAVGGGNHGDSVTEWNEEQQCFIPMYNIGDIVEVYTHWEIHIWTNRARIIDRYVAPKPGSTTYPHGIIRYIVKFLDDDLEMAETTANNIERRV